MLNGPAGAPVIAIHALLIQPALGPPSRIHPIAPTNGGIRNEASTMTCTKPRPGMSVRDTPQASGTAMMLAKQRCDGAELHRIDQRLHVARPAECGDVIGEGEAVIAGFGKTVLDQLEQRIGDQEHQHGRQQQRHQRRRIDGVTDRRRYFRLRLRSRSLAIPSSAITVR